MKRSSQVALLLIGVTSAGASAISLIPPRECTANPAAIAPGAISPQTLAPGIAPGVKPTVPCEPSRRSSWTSRSYWSSRSYSNTTSPTQPSGWRSMFSRSTTHTSVPSVPRSTGSRGGFGSFGHSVGAHAGA